jgi:positive regulator of sigma E activity
MKNIIRSVKLLYRISPLLILLLGIFTALSIFLSPLFSLNNILDFLSMDHLDQRNITENKIDECSSHSVEIELTDITYSYPGVEKKY